MTEHHPAAEGDGPLVRGTGPWFLAGDGDTRLAGLALGLALAPGHTDRSFKIYLSGTLGAGKTALARAMLAGLGVTDRVKSPTYTLIEPYWHGERRFNHFDLYRLSGPEDLEMIGGWECLEEAAVAIVEWPERLAGALPPPDLAIELRFSGAGRELCAGARSKAGLEVLERWRGK